MDFRKPGLKTGVKKDIYMKQARDLKNPAAHPNTNSEGDAPLATNGNRVSFNIDLLLNVPMAALFFRIKRHCGAIAERRLDCKSHIIFLFFKFPYGSK